MRKEAWHGVAFARSGGMPRGPGVALWACRKKASVQKKKLSSGAERVCSRPSAVG